MNQISERSKSSVPIETVIKISVPILQGLLASGHYTLPENVEDCVRIIRVDNGNDWKGVFAKKRTAMAIEHALSLAHELIKQIQLDDDPSPAPADLIVEPKRQ